MTWQVAAIAYWPHFAEVLHFLYKRAAKARPAAPSMKGAAVWMAPESPEEVPEPDADEPPEPEEPVVAVAASREAVEAAEPPAEMADWVASESSCWYVSLVCNR